MKIYSSSLISTEFTLNNFMFVFQEEKSCQIKDSATLTCISVEFTRSVVIWILLLQTTTLPYDLCKPRCNLISTIDCIYSVRTETETNIQMSNARIQGHSTRNNTFRAKNKKSLKIKLIYIGNIFSCVTTPPRYLMKMTMHFHYFSKNHGNGGGFSGT